MQQIKLTKQIHQLRFRGEAWIISEQCLARHYYILLRRKEKTLGTGAYAFFSLTYKETEPRSSYGVREDLSNELKNLVAELIEEGVLECVSLPPFVLIYSAP
jgi:hypothetical protein